MWKSVFFNNKYDCVVSRIRHNNIFIIVFDFVKVHEFKGIWVRNEMPNLEYILSYIQANARYNAES